jgi:hypothetical protein
MALYNTNSLMISTNLFADYTTLSQHVGDTLADGAGPDYYSILLHMLVLFRRNNDNTNPDKPAPAPAPTPTPDTDIDTDMYAKMRLLIHAGADVNEPINIEDIWHYKRTSHTHPPIVAGNTVLHTACYDPIANLEMILWLLDYGADFQLRNDWPDGDTALHILLDHWPYNRPLDASLLTRFLATTTDTSSGNDSDSTTIWHQLNHRGYSPLHLLCMHLDFAPDGYRTLESVLTYAAKHHIHLSMNQRYRWKGANNNGMTPLHIVLTNLRPHHPVRAIENIVTIMCKTYGAELEAVDEYDRTPVQIVYEHVDAYDDTHAYLIPLLVRNSHASPPICKK